LTGRRPCVSDCPFRTMTKNNGSFETRRRARAARLAAALLAAALAVAACSSDPLDPLGRDLTKDILGSRPGVVFQDTLDIATDTVLTYYTLIATGSRLDLGEDDDYSYAMIVRPTFAGAGADTTRIVHEAWFRILRDEASTTPIPARFHLLATPYSEGDSMTFLDTLSAVVDPGTGSADRLLTFADATYDIPPGLAQAWIRGDTANNGVAIVYTGAGPLTARFKSRSSTLDKATLQVVFEDDTTTVKSYAIGHDATFVRPLAATSNLIVSDGFVRRTYFRFDVGDLPDSAAVHAARLRFHIVDGTVRIGQNPTVVLYAPESDDPGSPAFQKERLITSVSVDEASGVIDLPVTNALLLILEGTIPDNGLVLRFDSENTQTRQVELYGSQAADSLRPRAFVTVSTPAEFDR